MFSLRTVGVAMRDFPFPHEGLERLVLVPEVAVAQVDQPDVLTQSGGTTLEHTREPVILFPVFDPRRSAEGDESP